MYARKLQLARAGIKRMSDDLENSVEGPYGNPLILCLDYHLMLPRSLILFTCGSNICKDFVYTQEFNSANISLAE